MTEVIRWASTNILEITVTDPVTGDPVTNATVEITALYDTAGDEVTGQTWPLAMAHTALGVYRGVLEHDIDVEPGQTVFAEYTVTQSTNVSTGRERLLVRRFG